MLNHVELVTPEFLEALKNDPRVTVVSDMSPLDRLCGIELTTDAEAYFRSMAAKWMEDYWNEALFVAPVYAESSFNGAQLW